ncbi:efflux RND transporter permease subunit [Crocinitomix algicola]|uniref:efflux RND transporter permease subunit n=1 Tax=Crocinitomix algicola TaxID=1740263 RepID=UPI00083174FA|nr:efflux RND transporter permease subunit [Crocinitomix algicola]
MLNRIVKFFLDNKLVAWIMVILFVCWGIVVSPFNFNLSYLPSDPVPVDAIPDIGENQQIIYTEWAGRSPQDVEDQITYPLTSALLGISGVKSVRSNSMFGFSSIYLIFDDDIDFYWSRSRIIEKLNSLPSDLLPEGVTPSLGPDATALGQVFWYTLEGQDEHGKTTGGWDLHELRTIQDFYVRYGLQSAEGVSEVASIGGFVQEYQIDVRPEKMKNYGITINEVVRAAEASNLDVGAQTVEINLAEYFVRGLGYVKKVEDIEKSVVKVVNNTPIRIQDIAHVHLGPAPRRGILDKSGAPAVGGVVVARYGANPMEVIQNIKQKMEEIAVGLPQKELADGRISHVKIIPFYDRSQLIHETIGTLEEALTLEVLITIIVVLLLLLHFKSSLLIAGSLPVAVLMCFIAMKYFGIDANIVALSGIAIAVGTMVDMGIVLTESMTAQLAVAPPTQTISTTIYKATTDVVSAVITAIATTIVSFLPVFTMQAAEGKLFIPLAYTKSFALLAAVLLAITVIPPIAEQLFKIKSKPRIFKYLVNGLLFIFGSILLFGQFSFLGMLGIVVALGGGLNAYFQENKQEPWLKKFGYIKNGVYALLVTWLLASIWMPLGVAQSIFINFIFVLLIIILLIGSFYGVIHFYEKILRFLLRIKYVFLGVIVLLLYTGFTIFKSTEKEFMPSLNEGSFLLMPTAMPHAGMEMNESNIRLLDLSINTIPEVEMVVGKAGRVESALDPAPMSMYEHIISYKSEYIQDENGQKIRFKTDYEGAFVYDNSGNLIPDDNGQYFRQWREHIKSPDDIWNEIINAAKIPGVTSAPKLQPIETRLVMLQTGMRAPMGIKVRGTNLEDIEAFGFQLETHLKEVKGVKTEAVFAERIVGKPYLMLAIKREKISRYGLTIVDVQRQLQTAIGGKHVGTTVEGRERFGIRVRYPMELRNDPERIKSIYIASPDGTQIPLEELVDVEYEQGAQAIKSENNFLLGYVLFDRVADFSEVEVVQNAEAYLQDKINDGTLIVPSGITYEFAGNYEQQVRSNKRLSVVLPIALLIIFLILYFQFKSVLTSLFVFSGVFVAFAGGFIMIWLYGQEWFMNFSLFGTNMRDLFQIHTIHLSVAVWVGFLALFGIATDDGVLVATFLKDSFKKNQPNNVKAIEDAVVQGGLRRVKPAMMTTATTILALLPVLTSTGKGADIMLPMAIPSFGGMVFNLITMFTVPVLYCIWKQIDLKLKSNNLLKTS